MKQTITRILILLILIIAISNIAFCESSTYEKYQKALDYLGEITFKSEYGNSPNKLCLFNKPIIIKIQGKCTQEDLNFAKDFIKELNIIVPNIPNVNIGDKHANIVITYDREDRLHKHVDNYVKGNWGFFYYYYNNRFEITSVKIAIASDVTTQEERNHLFIEELLGSLGLPNDSYIYKDSIFYQGWTTIQKPSDIDWLCLNIIYSRNIKPGMTYKQVRDIWEKRVD